MSKVKHIDDVRKLAAGIKVIRGKIEVLDSDIFNASDAHVAKKLKHEKEQLYHRLIVDILEVFNGVKKLLKDKALGINDRQELASHYKFAEVAFKNIKN